MYYVEVTVELDDGKDHIWYVDKRTNSRMGFLNVCINKDPRRAKGWKTEAAAQKVADQAAKRGTIKTVKLVTKTWLGA